MLFVSSHQYPLYPGTGAAWEIGNGRDRGSTLNIPLAAGARTMRSSGKYPEQRHPALGAPSRIC